MGLVRSTLICVLWGYLTLCSVTRCDNQTEIGATNALQYEVVEPRSRHRLQLLFPLLLRISTRLATLVPTALLGLLGIILFVVFSKKAFIISLFALFLSLSGRLKGKGDDIYIHKVNSYPDYNAEEHIHYHHREPLKFKKQYFGGNRPFKEWKKYIKRTLPSSPHIFNSKSWHTDKSVQPFKPLPSHLTRRTRPEEELVMEYPRCGHQSSGYGGGNPAFAQTQDRDK